MGVYIKLFMAAIFWGGTFIAGRVVAADIGPFSAAFLRFLIASVFLFIIVRIKEKRFPKISKNQLVPVILLGLTGVFMYNVFFFKGLKLIDAGRAAIIIANNPILISLFSCLIFKEKLTRLKAFGILISVSGAVIAISRGNLSGLFTGGLGSGEIFIFGCVASWVLYSLIGKMVMAHLSPLVSVTYSAAIGAACLFFPALLEGLFRDWGHLEFKDWASLFYLGVFGTVLSFVWYYEGIKRIGPMRASLFINFVPISAILLAFLILKEPLTPTLLVGTLFVCSGLYLTNRH